MLNAISDIKDLQYRRLLGAIKYLFTCQIRA